jgi:cellobiose phosphorylase
VEAGELTNSIAHGWSPIGAHQVKLVLEPGETRQIVFVLGYHENPKDQKFDPPGSQTINKKTVKPVIAKYLDANEGRRGLRAAAPVLGQPAGHLPGEYARHSHQPHGEYLERLPVHGHLQHVAVGVVL